MKRILVPLLAIAALAALFLKLPEIANFFACKMCYSSDPYSPLIAAGYFGVLLALALLFPAFPRRRVARGGLAAALALALGMTYFNLPIWCTACLVAHGCNIAIWGIWAFAPSGEPQPNPHPGARWCLLFFAPLSVVALFSSLNLTFLAYGFRENPTVVRTGIYKGDAIPSFAAQTVEGRAISNESGDMVLNFISPDCPYCKEQLQILQAVVGQLASSSYRFVNISPALEPDLIQSAPLTEWVEDKDNALRKLLKVFGTPTMIIVGRDGKVARVVLGVPEQLKDDLQRLLM